MPAAGQRAGDLRRKGPDRGAERAAAAQPRPPDAELHARLSWAFVSDLPNRRRHPLNALPEGNRRAGNRAMQTTTDVVIVAYNRFDLTESCLRHLNDQTLSHRLIVVDNGSTDGTPAQLRERWPQVHIERS